MIIFDIITIFPDIFDSYFNKGMVARARKKSVIRINVRDLRQFTFDNHRSVDDKPFSGGAGMILKIEPIYLAVEAAKKEAAKKEKVLTVLFSASGKKFTQEMAKKWANYDRIVMICGRYEGVDGRVGEYIADEEISIGDYVLTGGEIPAMAVVDSVSRLLPGVISKESLDNESFNKIGKQKLLEYPQYTRPEIFTAHNGKKWRVPKILLSGNHKLIEEWKRKKSRTIK